ncbi:MAG: 50S ribosome-binding GTPase, partial [Gemmatimonadetes bacterium]|nr:50S ribosome-binding GTPase [Gemmatimonadota bacterium]
VHVLPVLFDPKGVFAHDRAAELLDDPGHGVGADAGLAPAYDALVGRDRAIVTDVPGTTRDAIEAPISCDGFPFRLVDTAGLRSTDDEVERIGVEVSWRYLEGADLVLYCAEAGEDLQAGERQFLEQFEKKVVLVLTKTDLTTTSTGQEGIPTSAMSGEGLPELRTEMARFAFAVLSGRADIEPLVTRERHRAALAHALEETVAFREARASGIEGAVAAVHLRAAVGALETIVGVVTADDVLDRVFSSFCVGK